MFKSIKDIRKENHKDIALRDLDFTYDQDKNHYEPKKHVNAFNNSN